MTTPEDRQRAVEILEAGLAAGARAFRKPAARWRISWIGTTIGTATVGSDL